MQIRSPRLAAVVAPVCAAGVPLLIGALVALLTGPPEPVVLASIAALLAAAILAERFPVPLEGVDSGGISLGYVFSVSAVVLFGWAPAVLISCIATTFVHALEHRPPLRLLYNGSVSALKITAAAVLIAPIRSGGVVALLASVGIAAIADYVVNLLLIAAVVARSSRRPFVPSLQQNARATIVAFTLMASAALMLVILWQRSPLLSAALVGPLIAIALYQRSTFRALRAMKLALTDPLTGLGNHRHFHERLQRELVAAEEEGAPLTLCLVDIDDFKKINDRYGHPAGDRVLSQVATRLRQGGEAFRLGGDEFAVLMTRFDQTSGLPAAQSIVDRIRGLQIDHIGAVTVSAGVATFPSHGVGRDELIRLADSALYWAKEHGKNQVRVYRPDVVELAALKRLAAGPDRAARYRAAASLAKAVDARDTYTGRHSERVADLAARIAERMGVETHEVELTRLAASLHDLGKLAIPEEILRKPGPLTDGERLVLERHPQIGFRMLESLGVDPVAAYVLHHHERWDGRGYPDRLPGPQIPLGARIIFVADAYDAMTSDRSYRRRRSRGDAVSELERCAGTQFDPDIVSALAEELGVIPDTAEALAS